LNRITILGALLLALLLPGPLRAAEVLVLTLEGPIGPASQSYVEQGLARAQADGAELVLLRLDTPGGLMESMRGIVSAILAADRPVVTYVAPSGARAASAGTYILYASHLAAMAPATHVGAATPVAIGGSAAGEGASAMERKRVNDAVAYLHGLATLRGRNVEWAEQAVREAASIDAAEALALGVVEVVAPSTEALLSALDGRTVTLAEGRSVTLATQAAQVVAYDPDWRIQLLAVLTDPNVAYILLLLGIYGLIFEFSSPGALLPGVAGAISLMLALFAFQVLPINYAGAALILLGVVLMVAEAFVPSFGALGLGGIAALVVGSVILLDTQAPGFGLSPALITAVALFSLLLLAALIAAVARHRQLKVVSGAEQMVGSRAVALAAFQAQGQVRAHGEIWRAHSTRPVAKGQPLTITAIDGLTLTVVPDDTGDPGHV